MEYINSVPCGYQEIFPNKKYDLILLHKLLDNNLYTSYYARHYDDKNRGYWILDNSAFELGRGLNKDILWEWAKRLGVDEIVVPDVWENKNATLKRAQEFFRNMPKCKSIKRFQLVPQGKTEKQRMECLREMLKYSTLFNITIGINKLWGMFMYPQILGEVESFNKGSKRKIEFHKLGTNNLEEWFYTREFGWIRSADSRILAKIVTGSEDPWELPLTGEQQDILDNLLKTF